jgi:hypothetical protein
MVLFLRDLTRQYLAWSVTEKRKVSRLKSVLKWVKFCGTGPPRRAECSPDDLVVLGLTENESIFISIPHLVETLYAEFVVASPVDEFEADLVI